MPFVERSARLRGITPSMWQSKTSMEIVSPLSKFRALPGLPIQTDGCKIPHKHDGGADHVVVDMWFQPTDSVLLGSQHQLDGLSLDTYIKLLSRAVCKSHACRHRQRYYVLLIQNRPFSITRTNNPHNFSWCVALHQ